MRSLRLAFLSAQAGGVLLAPLNATITSALRALGLAHDRCYSNYTISR